MFKSVKIVGWMALITMIILIAFIIMDFTTKQRVESENIDGQDVLVVKKYPFGIGLKK